MTTLKSRKYIKSKATCDCVAFIPVFSISIYSIVDDVESNKELFNNISWT